MKAIGISDLSTHTNWYPTPTCQLTNDSTWRFFSQHIFAHGPVPMDTRKHGRVHCRSPFISGDLLRHRRQVNKIDMHTNAPLNHFVNSIHSNEWSLILARINLTFSEIFAAATLVFEFGIPQFVEICRNSAWQDLFRVSSRTAPTGFRPVGKFATGWSCKNELQPPKLFRKTARKKNEVNVHLRLSESIFCLSSISTSSPNESKSLGWMKWRWIRESPALSGAIRRHHSKIFVFVPFRSATAEEGRNLAGLPCTCTCTMFTFTSTWSTCALYTVQTWNDSRTQPGCVRLHGRPIYDYGRTSLVR